MTIVDWYLIGLLLIITGFTIYFVRRGTLGVPAATREPLRPAESLEEALEDMRLRGTVTPEEFSAELRVARDVDAPPPELPGLPRTPEEMKEPPPGDQPGRRPSRR